MANNDWNNLGRDIKDIVQDALDTGNFNRLNRDLGATLEDALGNVANSVKDAAKSGMDQAKNSMNQGSCCGGRGQDPKTKQRGRLPQDLHRQLFVE